MTPALFDVTEPSKQEQTCRDCGTVAVASVDTLRCSGWLAFDGVSWTSQPLHVRVCPACKSGGRPGQVESHGDLTGPDLGQGLF